jgi:hypothetical protein
MAARTRYFVIVSLLVLGVGLGTGLVAYYVGLPAGAFAGRGGPAELQYVPRDASVIAYADVRAIMSSELRQKVNNLAPAHEDGRRELQDRTGINLETDIDRVVGCLYPAREALGTHGSGMVLARGRFDEVKIEALMREHGARVETYNGKRVIVAHEKTPGDSGSTAPSGSSATTGQGDGFAVAFIEPGFVGLGGTKLVEAAIDLHQGGDNPQTGLASVTGNDELMNLVRSLDSGNAWAVGRFDALALGGRLPANIMNQIPAITWFSVSGQIDTGLRGVVRAEARDEEAATNLRDVIRGFMALAKMQAASKPQFQPVIQSLELGGTGTTVALSFNVPGEVFDALGQAAGKLPQRLLH